MPLACMVTPPPPCFSIPYANYNIVEISWDGGTTWNNLSITGTDVAGGQYTVGGVLWSFQTSCGLVLTGSQGLSITQVTNPTNTSSYASASYSATYPAQWGFPTLSGHPVSWPGGPVSLRTRCSGAGTTSRSQHFTNNNTPALAGLSFAKNGDSLFAWYGQVGTDASGSTLVNPTWPTGWTQLYSESNKRAYLAWKPNAAAGDGVSVTGVSSADNQHLWLFGARTRPSAQLITPVTKQNQAASLTPSSGALSFTGENAMLFALFENFRTSAIAGTEAVFSGSTGGFALLGQEHTNVVTGTPFYESLSSVLLTRGPNVAGTYTAGITSSKSYVWDSAIFAVR